MTADRAARRPRADGLRNRERLIEAARAAFAAGDDAVPFDEIARRAGVGIGTLYRHFPTRGALVEALYRSQVAALAEAAERLTAERSPLDALREWMLLFVDYMAGKRLIAAALEAAVGPGGGVFPASGERIKAAVRDLGRRAAEAGALDPAVDPVDFLWALSGILTAAAAGADADERARRLVDILLAGAAPTAASRS